MYEKSNQSVTSISSGFYAAEVVLIEMLHTCRASHYNV